MTNPAIEKLIELGSELEHEKANRIAKHWQHERDDIVLAAISALRAAPTDELEKVDYVGQIAVLQEKLRIAEAVTENSKRAHEMLCSAAPDAGWVMVPREPTDRIIFAMAKVWDNDPDDYQLGVALDTYRALIAAFDAQGESINVEINQQHDLKTTQKGNQSPAPAKVDDAGMVERVAKACYDARWEFTPHPPWADETEQRKEEWRDIARAALSAMEGK